MQIKESSVPAARRGVFREDILNAIREAIFSGELKPGDKIIETYWAKELGVSQGPVREAIRDLEALGLVETIPFKGSRVRILTKKDILDNYGVRICLEVKSIRDVLRDLSDAELKSLVTDLTPYVSEMEECARKGDLRGFSQSDYTFHKRIIERTDNPVLLKMWKQSNLRNWFMISGLDDPRHLKSLHEGHKELLNAIRARSTDKAVAILESHLTNLMDEFIQTMD